MIREPAPILIFQQWQRNQEKEGAERFYNLFREHYDGHLKCSLRYHPIMRLIIVGKIYGKIAERPSGWVGKQYINMFCQPYHSTRLQPYMAILVQLCYSMFPDNRACIDTSGNSLEF